jgi:hypothetical protein
MDKFIYFMQIDQVLMLPLGIKPLKSPDSRFFASKRNWRGVLLYIINTNHETTQKDAQFGII